LNNTFTCCLILQAVFYSSILNMANLVRINLDIFQHPKGIFKCVELILVILVLLITRFSFVVSNNIDRWILMCGTPVAFSIIISCSILYYLQGGKYTILDDIFTVFGMVLFLVAGIVSLYYGVQLQNYQSSLAQWLDWSTWVSELTNIAGNIFPTSSNIDKDDIAKSYIAYGSLSIITMAVFTLEFVWFQIKNVKRGG